MLVCVCVVCVCVVCVWCVCVYVCVCFVCVVCVCVCVLDDGCVSVGRYGGTKVTLRTRGDSYFLVFSEKTYYKFINDCTRLPICRGKKYNIWQSSTAGSSYAW